MPVYLSDEIATDANFDENAYLESNRDVAFAVRQRMFASGRAHFDRHGRDEGRSLRPTAAIGAAKRRKLARIEPLLDPHRRRVERPQHYDFLDPLMFVPEFRADRAGAAYDAHAEALIARHAEGWVLDVSAGRRSVYFDHVVNFDVIDYATTDVRGRGEELPFVDAAFDAVISIATLGRSGDPFACAREIVRVLKPGGSLLCCVPFLQAPQTHALHYYSMTHCGLRHLFGELLNVDQVAVHDSALPIWSLTRILQRWEAALHGRTRAAFRAMRVEELLRDPVQLLQAPFVTELSAQKNLELASETVLLAHKPLAPHAAVTSAKPTRRTGAPPPAPLAPPLHADFRLCTPRVRA